ncbi:aminopeptidase N [Thioclava dalianensis]|uniref:Aminopeptidase N n=1 Tax=Thioclava dalianensis TaxID=1185766 RepID=A0A074TJ33_9RHOB|nr:aminopeptidase N [Thioclava dalianensis]KEP71654.1 aminopeptidase N [Thioclava dalianensis]SFN41978.1 aminopeptidase N [Thioclava dalianensis]
MPHNAPAKRLSDYRAFPFELEMVRLDFALDPKATRVRAQIAIRPLRAAAALELDGEQLVLRRIAIDGRSLTRDEYSLSDTGLVIGAAALPAQPFTLETEVEIAPEENTALDGLYMSNGMYCTQCEAEGFRKITYYPDRPDVMAPFHVTVTGDAPVLLSNGNPVVQETGRAEWVDPWPKPAYLFALVAGDLVAHSGQFTTRSGREVALNIWVRPGDEDRCAFALGALQRAMAWDEQVYGREYDLDVFNIVAVDDFNMGAMENKGLNIFNSKWVLASPETATDADFERIEGIIAHEYFHNWTGNRITCRDWFQLCLKEGLTVFRDQCFTADMRLGPVKRIEDVNTLRARQFREDRGPLAHPPRPDHYREINNFYTATVYEKGAEIVRMLHTLVGEQGYRAALDLYFERHDGQACTIEDWLKVFEDSSGRDLRQFKRWYTDAGTPRVTVAQSYKDGTYTLEFRQETAPTPGQPQKPLRHIPITVGLLSPEGHDLIETTTLEMTLARQSFAFEGFETCPVPSILRGFSAPVVLDYAEGSAPDPAFLLAHDSDPFNRWEAGRRLSLANAVAMAQGAAAPDARYLEAMGALLADESADPAFRALCLHLPSEDQIAQSLHERGMTPDPDAIHTAHEAMITALAQAHEPLLAGLYDAMAVPGDYRPDPEPAGKRALRLAALAFLSRLDGGARARALFESADNMTESLAALAQCIGAGVGAGPVDTFRARWSGDRLVMDKWFTTQLSASAPEQALARVEALVEDPLFDWKNPNRFRALMSGFSGNHAGFHRADGEGYRFYADWLWKLDALNPQVAARMSTAFETWARYDAGRQAHVRSQLERIMGEDGLSRDLSEMTARMLG